MLVADSSSSYSSMNSMIPFLLNLTHTFFSNWLLYEKSTSTSLSLSSDHPNAVLEVLSEIVDQFGLLYLELSLIAVLLNLFCFLICHLLGLPGRFMGSDSALLCLTLCLRP